MPFHMDDKTVYVEFLSEINSETARALRVVCDQALNEYQAACLYFIIASPGGANAATYSLFGFLRSLLNCCRIITHNIGTIDSAGIFLFLSGQERSANPISRFLLHGPVLNYQAGSYTLAKLRHDLAVLQNDIDLYWRLLSQTTKIDRAKFDEAMVNGRIWLPEEAKNDGLIHDITELSLSRDTIRLRV
mgnify:FL=1